tara:strand:- start:92 stop:349 length:258 start_codon:yes stop_codon:yes gene_type:complete
MKPPSKASKASKYKQDRPPKTLTLTEEEIESMWARANATWDYFPKDTIATSSIEKEEKAKTSPRPPQKRYAVPVWEVQSESTQNS